MTSPASHNSRGATAIVFVTVFIDLIGFGIVLPLLPGYAARFHASDAAIGVLVASFSLMQFLFAPWWGRLSDRVGRRPVLLVGLAGSAVSYLIFALANGFWLLLVSRVVAGVMGATVNVAQAYLADVTPPEERSRAMGLIGAAFGLGFVVGPLIGGLSVRWGDAAPGFVASALTAGNLLLASFRLPETRVHVPSRVRGTLHWRRLAAPYSIVALSTIAFTVMYVVFPLEVERGLNYSRQRVAYLFTLIGLVSAAVQGGMVGRLVPRFGERRLMVSGSVVQAIGFTALALILGRSMDPRLQVLALTFGLVLLAAGTGLVGPSATGLVSRQAPPGEQGTALGALLGVGAVSRVVGPVFAGLLQQHAGGRTAFAAAAVAGVLGGIIAGGSAEYPSAPPVTLSGVE